MIDPSLDKLMKKVDSRYTLVITAAKRARMLGQIHRDDESYFDTDKAVSIATREIGEGKVTYTREEYVPPVVVYDMPNYAVNYALHEDKDEIGNEDLEEHEDEIDEENLTMEDAIKMKDVLIQREDF